MVRVDEDAADELRCLAVEGDVLASKDSEFRLDDAHWNTIQSTNPLERVNREIKRRVDVVQVFPNDDALLRLVTAVPFEMHDEWIAAFPRRYLPQGSMGQIYPSEPCDSAPALPNTTNTTDD